MGLLKERDSKDIAKPILFLKHTDDILQSENSYSFKVIQCVIPSKHFSIKLFPEPTLVSVSCTPDQHTYCHKANNNNMKFKQALTSKQCIKNHSMCCKDAHHCTPSLIERELSPKTLLHKNIPTLWTSWINITEMYSNSHCLHVLNYYKWHRLWLMSVIQLKPLLEKHTLKYFPLILQS